MQTRPNTLIAENHKLEEFHRVQLREMSSIPLSLCVTMQGKRFEIENEKRNRHSV